MGMQITSNIIKGDQSGKLIFLSSFNFTPILP